MDQIQLIFQTIDQHFDIRLGSSDLIFFLQV